MMLNEGFTCDRMTWLYADVRLTPHRCFHGWMTLPLLIKCSCGRAMPDTEKVPEAAFVVYQSKPTTPELSLIVKSTVSRMKISQRFVRTKADIVIIGITRPSVIQSDSVESSI
jgi:hypothetical protein